jgi:hypothetical protein
MHVPEIDARMRLVALHERHDGIGCHLACERGVVASRRSKPIPLTIYMCHLPPPNGEIVITLA